MCNVGVAVTSWRRRMPGNGWCMYRVPYNKLLIERVPCGFRQRIIGTLPDRYCIEERSSLHGLLTASNTRCHTYKYSGPYTQAYHRGIYLTFRRKTAPLLIIHSTQRSSRVQANKAIMAPLIRALSIRRQCTWRFGPVGTNTTTRGSGTAASIAATLWLRRGLSSSAVVQQGGAKCTPPAQTQSPLGKIGVAAALSNGEGAVKPTLWDEFALQDRVALVSGANRGLGLEMALVLVEAGARAVYCVDLPKQPGDEWTQVAEYVRRMETVKGRLEYVCADVGDQKAMWKVGEDIGDREGRMDVSVAAAGILRSNTDCLEYPASEFEEVRVPRSAMCDSDGAQFYIQVIRVNTNGVLYTAQAAGRQMARFGNGGSIILIASMSGSITNKVCSVVFRYVVRLTSDIGPRVGILQYKQIGRVANGTKHGVRAGPEAHPGQYTFSRTHLHFVSRFLFRVLRLDPGDGRLHIELRGHHGAVTMGRRELTYYYRMTAAYLDTQPHLLEKWSQLNPLGRIGRPDELRGVIAWLASDASTFCTGSE